MHTLGDTVTVTNHRYDAQDAPKHPAESYEAHAIALTMR
jgi:hypothetical protein